MIKALLDNDLYFTSLMVGPSLLLFTFLFSHLVLSRMLRAVIEPSSGELGVSRIGSHDTVQKLELDSSS
jgi:hypothetical protein